MPTRPYALAPEKLHFMIELGGWIDKNRILCYNYIASILNSIESIIKKEAIKMKNMAISNPLFTMYFAKVVPSFEEAANAFLNAVGAVGGLNRSLISKSPLYLTRAEGEELSKYRERLLNCYGALWGSLTTSEHESLKPFVEREDLNEKELEELGRILVRCHQRIRKFRTPEELERYRVYLYEVTYTEEEKLRPTITSDSEILFHYALTSWRAWIAIEKTIGGFLIEGEANFVSFPYSVVSTLKSKAYEFKTEVRLVATREAFTQYVLGFGDEYKLTSYPNGEMRFDFNSGSYYLWLELKKAQTGEYYIVKAQKPDSKPVKKRYARVEKLGRESAN